MSDHTTRPSSEEIPYGYCHCGCGQKTKLASRNVTKDGIVKGEPLKYIQWHSLALCYDSLEDAFNANCPPGAPNECWIWQGSTGDDGYGKLYFKGKFYAAHRAAWMLANNTDIPKGMCVCHNCPGGDNRSCCNPAHLWLGTIIANNLDRDKKGRQAKGEKVKSSRLTEDDVRKIFEMKESGLRQCEIAKAFSLKPKYVAHILKGRVWSHVKP